MAEDPRGLVEQPRGLPPDAPGDHVADTGEHTEREHEHGQRGEPARQVPAEEHRGACSSTASRRLSTIGTETSVRPARKRTTNQVVAPTTRSRHDQAAAVASTPGTRGAPARPGAAPGPRRPPPGAVVRPGGDADGVRAEVRRR